ncbi:unnamed protein product [Ceratitis capitata]|uniref:(Mediterranean fruit fly) hypothetical protein n=1 Tax=Ceratitis capitata TaxID=7213 RepID=A0A811UK33_CERCA|nr:unnamed protein product [Ceratitis capitata]
MKLSFAFYLYAPVHRRYQHLAGCSFATRTLFCNALKCNQQSAASSRQPCATPLYSPFDWKR